jgi:hypothetical protein
MPKSKATNKINKPFRVQIIESERGWGQQIDSVEYFATKAEAEKFVKKFNAKNNEATVPDWYMYATLVD